MEFDGDSTSQSWLVLPTAGDGTSYNLMGLHVAENRTS